MSQLSIIPGIGKASLELLEAAGFQDAESLAKAGVDQLALELVRANEILKIAKRPPPRGNIEKWIRAARHLVGEKEEAPVTTPTMPVNFEATVAVASMLSHAPFAIPLPARYLIAKELGVSDIPPGILLNRYSGDLEIRMEDRLPGQKNPRQSAAGYVQIAENQQHRVEIDPARFRTMAEAAKNPKRTPGSPAPTEGDRVALIRAPRESANQGRDPSSRRYLRGVLHSHPSSIYGGAVVTLMLMMAFPAAVISSGLLLLSEQMPARFGWVPPWLLVFPVLLPVIGVAWLIWSAGGSCRICGQKLFIPKSCLKNTKAHHIPGLGYILPLCFHILFFHWFRCTHCGTPVRVKK